MQKDTILRRQLFVSLGLSDKESLLYDILLKYGQLPAASLEKISGLKKNTYILLKSLERRGLVQKMIKDGKSHYIVGSPDKLKVFLAEQESRVGETKAMLAEMLPNLRQSYKEVVDRPVIEYLAGEAGVRQAFEQAYSGDKTEIYGCVGWIEPGPIVQDVISRLSHLRVERGIKTYAINNDNPTSREFKKRASNPANLAEVHLIDKTKYPMPVEIDVWNDTVAIMNFSQNDFQSVFIHHPQIALTLKSLMRLTFDLLRARVKA